MPGSIEMVERKSDVFRTQARWADRSEGTSNNGSMIGAMARRIDVAQWPIKKDSIDNKWQQVANWGKSLRIHERRKVDGLEVSIYRNESQHN